MTSVNLMQPEYWTIILLLKKSIFWKAIVNVFVYMIFSYLKIMATSCHQFECANSNPVGMFVA